jgi:hypothetical protein
MRHDQLVLYTIFQIKLFRHVTNLVRAIRGYKCEMKSELNAQERATLGTDHIGKHVCCRTEMGVRPPDSYIANMFQLGMIGR